MTDSPIRTESRHKALIVTIDNPPLNVIHQAVRSGLLAVCDEAEVALAAGTIDRVILTGAGRAFVAGADVKEFDQPPLEPHLPDVLSRLITLPVIAAINGAALGGGLEIALACRVRIAAPETVMGLPEVILGVVPGAGGTQRLPRLIGLENALPLIASGRTLKAPEALALGIVDALADNPVAAALAIPAGDLPTRSIDDLPAPAPAPLAAESARIEAEKQMPAQIAPLRAIALMEAASFLPVPEGMARERATFLELRTTEEARTLRQDFFVKRAAARLTKGRTSF